MNTTTLQIPMSKDLKSSATAVAKEFGFSSLQEIVRVLLTKLARKELTMGVTETTPPEYIMLSPSAKRRYARVKEDIEKGRNVTKTNSPKELLQLLRS